MAARVFLPSMMFASSEQKGCFSRESAELRELDGEAAGGRQAFWYPVVARLWLYSPSCMSHVLDLHTASYSAKEDVISKQKGIKT